MCVCVCVYKHTHIHTHIYIYIYTIIHTHIAIHTHTHTHSSSSSKILNRFYQYRLKVSRCEPTPRFYLFFFLWSCGPRRAMASSFKRFLDHTQRRTTVSRTPLDEWSARRRDLYLTTHNTHNKQTSMPPAGFEPTISTGERPQTYVLDRAATGTGPRFYIHTHTHIHIYINIYIL